MSDNNVLKKILTKKSVIITGGSVGLGLVIAEHFLKNGANVMICARDQNKINTAVKKLQQFYTKNTIIGLSADISSQAMCQKIIDTALEQFGRLDVLINNAGIHGGKGSIDSVNWNEWESAIDVNLKGTAFLCHLAVPIMKKQKSGKIIIISGGGATKPIAMMSAYAASKAGLVRFSECLAEELKPYHIDVNAVAPGALNTALLDDIIKAGADRVGELRYQNALIQKKNGGDDPNRAAELCVFLASDKSNGITGKLISAIWDPWTKLQQHCHELKNTDIYTLRRILPQDRGMDWGS